MNAKAAIGSDRPKTQDVCIDLPGDSVQCWRSSDYIRVILRKHRDVFFDINLRVGAVYTVESSYDFYCPRDKKLLRKVKFADGEHFNVWVGRGFKGSLKLKADGKVIGSYEVNGLDPTSYDADPKTKPEPLLIMVGQKEAPRSLMCTAEDPFGMVDTQVSFKVTFDPKLSLLKDFGTKFDYFYPDEPPEVAEYVAVTEAQSQEIQPQIVKQLDAGEAVEGSLGQIFLPPQRGHESSPLYRAIGQAARSISGNSFLTGNTFKESAGYLIEHFKSLDKISMSVRIEKKIKGKYKVAIKGRPLSMILGHALGSPNNAKPVHEKIPLGSKGSTFIDGGFAKNGNAGYGGVRRIMLTSAKNFRAGTKIQVIGTVIDIIVDANTVFLEETGSRDLSEFLGRAGVSIAKAGVTAALGSAFAAAGIAFLTLLAGVLGTGALPVIAVVTVAIGGYILAATAVDWLDDKLHLKTEVAKWAR